MSPLPPAEATELLYREAHYLDTQRWDDWLALYREDAEFWMPAWKDAHALTESPDSFSPTAASALAHDDAYWQRSARRAAESPDFEMFIVRRDGHGLGLGSAGRDTR